MRAMKYIINLISQLTKLFNKAFMNLIVDKQKISNY